MSVLAAKQAISTIGGSLIDFISGRQRIVLMQMLDGEEKKGVAEVLLELADCIEGMPHSYQTDGQKDEAIVYLHYFSPGADFYITEKDVYGGGHRQAFGYTRMVGRDGELGYISIEVLTRHGMELDLYWDPKPLKDVK